MELTTGTRASAKRDQASPHHTGGRLIPSGASDARTAAVAGL